MTFLRWRLWNTLHNEDESNDTTFIKISILVKATGGTKKIDITYTFIHPENFFFLMEESGTELALNLTKFAGNNLYPFAAALVAAWDTLAMSLQVPKKQLSVEFRDVHLYGQPALFDTRQLRLSVTLHRGTGRFEVWRHLHILVSAYTAKDNGSFASKWVSPWHDNRRPGDTIRFN